MLLATVVAVCVASHAVASAATVPLPEKVYYDLGDAENLFKQHVKEYQRKYDVIEYKKRLAAFKTQLKKINKLNARHPRTVFGITQFTDLTSEEIKQLNGFKLSNNIIEKEEIKLPLSLKKVPDSFDWREHGVVSPVKNQGLCGSCYIFSAIGNIEGQYAIKHKQCIAFSEQQCLDCSHNKFDCRGGFPQEIMNYLAKSGGCMKEEDYPYIGKDRQPCKEKPDKAVAKVTRAIVLNITDAEDLKKKLYAIGPLSIGLDAIDFYHYTGGVLRPTECSSDPREAGHAVLLVGYGEENGEKYWIIKDSYGVKEREHGYVRLLRGVNACGVEKDFAATAVVV